MHEIVHVYVTCPHAVRTRSLRECTAVSPELLEHGYVGMNWEEKMGRKNAVLLVENMI